MKHSSASAFVAIAAFLGGGILKNVDAAGHDHHGAKAAIASDTITGEVVDLACYLGHGSKGKDHAKCAKQCIQKGLPVGLLTDQGEVFLAVGPNHMKANELLASKAAKTVTVVGKKSENSGVKLIEIHKVMKGDSGAKAAAIPIPVKVTYACPMHPEVSQESPGKCPKCGMALEKIGK